MSAREDRATHTMSSMVRALDAMDDGMLRTLIIQAQTVLLDRPVPPEDTGDLAVDIVDGVEARLLHAFRALDAVTRVQVSAAIAQLARRECGCDASPSMGAGLGRRGAPAGAPASAGTRTCGAPRGDRTAAHDAMRTGGHVPTHRR